MTVIFFPDIAPRYRRARAALLLLLFSGLLTFAAVLDAGVNCQKQPTYLLTESGAYLLAENGSRLTAEDNRRQCQLVAGRFQIPLPALAVALTMADKAREFLEHR